MIITNENSTMMGKSIEGKRTSKNLDLDKASKKVKVTCDYNQ